MKNINVYFENFSNKHKLNLMRVLVSGTLVVNSLALTSCGSINNDEEVISQEEDNFEIAKTNNDETWEYFDQVVEPDMFETLYINCDEFPETIRNKEETIPSTFYEILNTSLKTGDYTSMVFYNDTGIINHSAISSDYVEEIRFEPSLGIPPKYLLNNNKK